MTRRGLSGTKWSAKPAERSRASINTSLLAAAVLPLSTSYAICETFGFERGVSRSFSEASVFQSIFTGLIVLGVLITLIPGLPIIQVLIVLQDLNAAMLPILLVNPYFKPSVDASLF